MGRKGAPKRKPAADGVDKCSGAPGQPPSLKREISGSSSPLVRHDNVERGSGAIPTFSIEEQRWSEDCGAVLQELASKKLTPSSMLALHKTYTGFADTLGADEDGIFGEGILRFFEALDVDPGTDLVALSFSHQCQAQGMGILRRREFIRGMVNLGVDATEGLRRKVPELRHRLTVLAERRDIYLYAFNVALDSPCKLLDIEDACRLWELFFPEWPLLDAWCTWASENFAKPCSKDLWGMFWLFATEVPADLSTYDDCPDWPVTLDQFVEHLRAKRS